jgi:hypothetical protein
VKECTQKSVVATMKNPLNTAAYSALTVLLVGSCNFPYQPERFVLPEVPYKFPSGQSVRKFAGDALKVKFAFTLNEGFRSVYFVDFQDPEPQPVKLKKTSAGVNLHADSPIISPDGSFVAYFLTQGGATVNGAYIQRLDALSEPVLIADNGTEPHWWVDDNGEMFIIYSDNMLVPGALVKGKGTTWKRKVDLAGSGSVSGPPVEIAPFPMNGGLSHDGRYLCTGYEQAAFYDVVDGKLTAINSDPVQAQVCNPSINPDTAHPDWMMFLNFAGVQGLINPFANEPDYPASVPSGKVPMHALIYIVDIANTVRDYVPVSIMGSGYEAWQDPEWSNDPSYATVLALIDESKADGVLVKNIGQRNVNKETMVLTIGTGKLNITSTPYLWIGRED